MGNFTDNGKLCYKLVGNEKTLGRHSTNMESCTDTRSDDSSTSRPRDTLQEYYNISQQSSQIELGSALVGTVNKENSDTNNQVKDMASTYGNLKMECSSLYTWLVGETDQNYSVSINTGTNDSTT